MTIDQLNERLDELLTEARGLIDDHPDGLTGDAAVRFDEIETEATDVRARIDQQHRLAALADHPNIRVSNGADGSRQRIIDRTRNPFDPPTTPETSPETRSRAIAAVERWPADDTLKESAIRTLEAADVDLDAGRDDVRGVADHILRYSNPAYVEAFRKYARDPETFAASLTADEQRAWASGREHARATLQLSGAVLPSPLDPTIVLTSDGVTDPMRQVARVDTTTSKSKRYITSAGSTFSFDAELAEVSDDTHTETEVEITPAKAQGWINASIETAMDQPDFSSEVAKIIADGKATLEGSAYVTGSGSDAPKGIQTALAGGASEIDAAGEALVADDVYGLLEALPPRFRNRARWQLELSTANFIHRLWNPSGSEPPLIEDDRLLRLPYHLNSSVDAYSDVDAGATANNYVLFVGDWSKFVILDRVGLAVNFIGPGHVLSTANNRPDGSVGWYAYWRTGSDVLTISAFRMLDVATTA